MATLLYEGPWVAERYLAIRAFIEAKPEALHPVTRAITEKGIQISARPTPSPRCTGSKRWSGKRASVWDDIDCLVTPTAGTAYTIAAVEADPIRLNSNLGHYTNFVNLLDLSAVAVPTGFMTRPWPTCPVASRWWRVPAGLALADAGRTLARAHVPTVGATPHAPHQLAIATPDARLVSHRARCGWRCAART